MIAPLIAIIGPTGTGKTRLSIELARRFNGEIVNGDSRQIYRHMDIGTAKPDPRQLSEVPHHLFDIIDPDQDFSLAEYQKLALASITDIQSRNKYPILVGGSGQYVWSLLEGWKIPAIAPDLTLRAELQMKADAGEAQVLYDELKRIDPAAAKKIDPRNIRRVIRAIEVNRAGHLFSELQQKNPPGWKIFILGLTAPREALYEIIDRRVDEMITNGLVQEVENLLKIGYDIKLPAMSGLGYRDITLYLHNEIDMEEAKRRIKVDNHRFIRHQYAWFRLADHRITWFDICTDYVNAVNTAIEKYYGA